MKIFNKAGSKERLFEMMSRVNKILLNEAVIPVGTKIPLKGLTFDKLGFQLKPETSKGGEQYQLVTTEEWFPSPNEGDVNNKISTDKHFSNWFNMFLKKHGDEGFLTKISDIKWDVIGNDKFSQWRDQYVENKAAGMEKDSKRNWSTESVIKESGYEAIKEYDVLDGIDDTSNDDNSDPLPQEPEEHDCVVSSNGWKLSVSCGGKFIDEFEDDDKAYAAVREWKKRNNWYPNTWFISDHGNVSLVDDNGNMIGEGMNEGKGSNEISYKGKTIKKLHPSGYYEYYSDKNGRFVKSDDLNRIKSMIDNELGNMNEGNSKLSQIKSSNPALYNQLMVAKKTMKMNDAMVGVMGGMSKEEARQLLMKHGMLKEEDDSTSSVDGDYTKGNENYKKAIATDLKNTGHNVSNKNNLSSIENKDGLFKETVDSIVDFDKAYLDNSIDTEETNVSKYDGGLDYPEKNLRVDSNLLHQEPIVEYDYNQEERDYYNMELDADMNDFRPLTLKYNDQTGNWLPVGHEDKGYALRVTYHPIGSNNEKTLLVNILPDGKIKKILKVYDNWDKAKEELKKYL